MKRRYANLKKALKKSKTSDLEVAALRGSAEDFDPRYRAKIESMIKREKEAQAKAERAAERRAGTKPAGSRGRRTRGEAERRLDELAGSAAAGEPDAAKAYSEAAEKAYEGLDYARALQLSERALEADPNDPKAKKLAEETRALLGVSREWAKEGLAKLRDEKKIVIQESLIALQQAVEKGKELQASAGEAGPGGAEAPEHEVLARKARDLDESVAQYRKSLEIMKWMPYQVDLSAKEKEVRASLAEAERARSKALAELRQEKKSASLGRVTGAALEELKMEPRTLGDLGEEAKKLIANGDFAGAERLAKSALKLDPGNKDLGALAQDARQKRHEKRLLDEQLAEAGVPYSGYLVYAEDWKEVARREGGEGRSIEHEVLREKVRQLTTMAQIEYERGNYERAEELSKRVLDRDRTNKDAKALVHQSRQKRHEEREEEQWAGWTWDPAPLAVEEAAIPYSERLRHPKDRKSGRRGRRGKPASEPDYWARSTAYTNETLPSGWRLAQAGTAGGAEAAKPEGEWTARGQEDAISDIPLGGTGVVGNLGVGGGGAGCFGFRSGGGRRRAALSGGGSAASENSVDRSLEWLWRHQRSDGSWSVRDFGGTIGEDADVGLTGLALLSFLGGGHTEKSGTPKYQAAVRKAVAYLRANQKPDGSIGENSGKAQSGSGYNHAIAGLALAEAFGMARVAETGAAAQKAVDYSVNIHQEPYSGWRYRPKERADMSVTGWFVMQLKSAIISGLRVDGKGFQGATAFLDKCTKRGGGHEGLVSYRPERSYTPTMTAIGLFCRQLMGGKRSQPALYGAANYLSSNLPDRNAPNHYYWYHGTNAMYQMGGAWWKMWNASVRDMLIEKQRRGPPKIDGSWDAEGPWTKQGGRALSTALGALILEAYYRYLPLYQGSGMQPEPAAGRDAKAGGPGTRARADAEAGVPSESPLWQAALELLGVAKEEERAPGAVPAKLLEAAARGEAAGEPEPFVKLAPGEAAALEAAKAAKAAEEAKAAAESAMIEKEPEPEPEPKPEPEEEEAPEAPEKAIEDLPPPPVNPFVLTARDRFSTFALDTDTASYTIARRHISAGRLPPRRSVRMEEWVNAFDYNYPRQARDVFNIFTEGTPAPFGKGLYLLKIGVQAKVIGREGRKPAHLVFVVDTSGSMERPDRLALVKHALGMLVSQLSPRDRVSLVSYGTKARIAFEAVPATEARRIVGDVFSLQIGGSTNMFEGLVLGYEIAKRQFRAGEVNRVILCSDGVANVGPTEAGEILEKVKRFRDWGVALTTAGFGAGSYNDEMLERLANSGDGNYVFIDSPREARRVFVEEMSATLQTVAKDAKIQVEFDPRRVRRYRLIGYENRDIADKDFRNDAVDAGEVGSGKSATALYEIELLSGPSAGFAGSRPAAPPPAAGAGSRARGARDRLRPLPEPGYGEGRGDIEAARRRAPLGRDAGVGAAPLPRRVRGRGGGGRPRKRARARRDARRRGGDPRARGEAAPHRQAGSGAPRAREKGEVPARRKVSGGRLTL